MVITCTEHTRSGKWKQLLMEDLLVLTTEHVRTYTEHTRSRNGSPF